MLRPIGTQFIVSYPPCINSTDPYGHEILYEVAAHVKIARFLGDKEGPMAEEWNAIKVTEILPEWMKRDLE